MHHNFLLIKYNKSTKNIVWSLLSTNVVDVKPASGSEANWLMKRDDGSYKIKKTQLLHPLFFCSFYEKMVGF